MIERPNVTEMRGVVVETVKTTHDPERGSIKARVRPRPGRRILGMVLDAMNDGHTVTMRTYYEKQGSELMDADIVWDGGKD